jgi:hypothetical protein
VGEGGRRLGRRLPKGGRLGRVGGEGEENFGLAPLSLAESPPWVLPGITGAAPLPGTPRE